MSLDKQFINNDTPLISISVVADLLNTHPRTLMLYEYEKLVIPKRSPTKRRMYSQNEVMRIKFIQYLTRQKKVNFAGIRIILAMINRAQKEGIDLRAEMFPDFKE